VQGNTGRDVSPLLNKSVVATTVVPRQGAMREAKPRPCSTELIDMAHAVDEPVLESTGLRVSPKLSRPSAAATVARHIVDIAAGLVPAERHVIWELPHVIERLVVLLAVIHASTRHASDPDGNCPPRKQGIMFTNEA